MDKRDEILKIAEDFNPLKEHSETNQNNLNDIQVLVYNGENKIVAVKLSDLVGNPVSQNNKVKEYTYTYQYIQGVPSVSLITGRLNRIGNIIVAEDENVIFSMISTKNTINTIEKYLFKPGKGTYGNTGTLILNADLILIYQGVLAINDVLDTDTVTYIIEDLATMSLVDYINTGTESYIVNDTVNNDTLFIVGDGAVTDFYLFVGAPGTYGFNASAVTNADFLLLPNDTGVPTLDNVTNSGNVTYSKIIAASLANNNFNVLNNEGFDIFNNNKALKLRIALLTANRAIMFPDKSGTVALTSDLGNVGALTEDILTQMPNGVTFGNILSGETLPLGMTLTELVKKATQIALPPTVTLTSASAVAFNQTAISITLTMGSVINTNGASIGAVNLEYQREGDSAWVSLTNDNTLNTFIHTLTDTQFNTLKFKYRYTVTDSAGGISTANLTITPANYVAPSIVFTVRDSDGVIRLTREKGDKASIIEGTITKSSTLVALVNYQIHRSIDGSTWDNISGTIAIPSSPHNFSYEDDDILVLNSTTARYRIAVMDEKPLTTTTSPEKTVTFLYRNTIGYASNSPISLAQILGFTNYVLSNAKARTIDPVTAGVGLFTYIAYNYSAADLTDIILVTTPILGAFTKLSDVTGVNSFGATVTYRVYKSNATNAFTNDKLILT